MPADRRAEPALRWLSGAAGGGGDCASHLRRACSFPDGMAPESKDEQSREERLEIARRYRERRGRELRELAAPWLEGEVEAAGEFSGVPTEALAAIPLFGMLMLPWARRRSRRSGLPAALLVAIDRDTVHVLERGTSEEGRDRIEARPVMSWPRGSVRVESVRRAFMRNVVNLDVPDRDEPLILYAPSLRTNPWSAEVVRLLGGEAPAPLDLDTPPA